MKNLDMLIVQENGQVAIDFDALELITSTEFVEEVKSCLWLDEKYHKTSKIVVHPDKFVIVYIMDEQGFMETFTFRKDNKTFFSDSCNPNTIRIWHELMEGN